MFQSVILLNDKGEKHSCSVFHAARKAAILLEVTFLYGDRHPFIQRTSSDRFIFGMTLIQLLVVISGGKLSYELSKVVPDLPINNFVLRHIHQGIPLYVVAALVFLEDNVTGRVMAFSLFDRLSSRWRRRIFVYSRGSD